MQYQRRMLLNEVNKITKFKTDITNKKYQDNALFVIEMFCQKENIIKCIKADYKTHEEFYIQEMKAQYINDIVNRPYLKTANAKTAILLRIVAVYLFSGKKNNNEIIETFKIGYPKFVNYFKRDVTLKDYFYRLLPQIDIYQRRYIIPSFIFLSTFYNIKINNVLIDDDFLEKRYISMLYEASDTTYTVEPEDNPEYAILGEILFNTQSMCDFFPHKNNRLDMTIKMILGELGFRWSILDEILLEKKELAIIAKTQELYIEPKSEVLIKTLHNQREWFFDRNDTDQMACANSIYLTVSLFLIKFFHLYTEAKELAIVCNDELYNLRAKYLLARKENSILEKSIESLQLENNRLQSKIENKQYELDKFKTENICLFYENFDLKNRIETLEATIEDLKNQSAAATSEQVQTGQ